MAFGFDIKSQKILGSLDPKGGKWSIAYEYDPEDASLLSLRGRIYIVVDFEGNVGIDLHLASKILIDTIKEHYYGDLEGTPLQALESAIVFGKDRLVEVINKEGVLDLTFNIVSCVVWDSILYIAQSGTTTCLLIRGGEITDISHKTSGEVMTSSGILESEDVVIIASKKFSEEFNNSNLVGILANLEAKFIESVNAPLLAAVMVRFKKSSMPSKKDLAGIVKMIKFNKKVLQDKKIDIYTENKTEPLESKEVSETEPAVITSLVDEPVDALANKNEQELIKQPKADLVEKQADTVKTPVEKNLIGVPVKPTGNKRGRKIKHLLTSLFTLVLVSAFIYTAYSFYSKSTDKKVDSINTVTPEVERYLKVYNELQSKGATESDYKGLLKKIEQDGNLDNKEFKDLVLKINKTLTDTAKANEAKNKYLVYNFLNESKQANLNKVSIVENVALVSDFYNKTNYFINLESKEKTDSFVLGTDYLISYYDTNTLYFLEKQKINTGTSIKTLSEYTMVEDVLNASDLFVYFGGIYVIEGNSIVKLTLEGKTYSKSIWAKLNNTATSIAVDGNVFLVADNSIKKMFKGEDTDFVVDKNVEVNNSSKIYTNIDLKNLYILNSNKLFIVNKDTGVLQKQIDLDAKFNNIASFVYSNNSLYILTKSELYKYPIEQ